MFHRLVYCLLLSLSVSACTVSEKKVKACVDTLIPHQITFKEAGIAIRESQVDKSQSRGAIYKLSSIMDLCAPPGNQYISNVDISECLSTCHIREFIYQYFCKSI